HAGADLFAEHRRDRRHVAEAADPVLRRPVPEGPPPVLEERVTQPERGTEGLVAVLGVLPRVAVQVESAREGAIEQQRIGEADHALTRSRSPAQAPGDLPPPPEEVA